MKLTIKTATDEQYNVTIPNNSTISDLKLTAIVASNSLESANINSYSLYFHGRKLDLLKNISDYELHDQDTVIIACSLSECAGLEALASTNSDILDTAITNTAKKDFSSKPKQSLGVSKKKKLAKKCNFTNCNNASLRIIGNCQDCGGKYCSKHRLLENHLCVGLQNCKNIAFSRNANKLHQEQTISQKV